MSEQSAALGTNGLILQTSFFDLKFVHDNFSACLLDDDDLALDKYLNGYKELQKFCHLLGTVFGFVGSEIRSKMEILEELRLKNRSEHFSTMKKMIQYEMENNLLKDSSYISGSRTLLRLHRGLDFLRQFLKKVGELAPEDNTHHIGQEVYKETLAKYHSWLIRKGASLAMCVLPTREVLLQRACGENTQSALESLPDMLESTNKVYQRTEDYYTQMGLHELP